MYAFCLIRFIYFAHVLKWLFTLCTSCRQQHFASPRFFAVSNCFLFLSFVSFVLTLSYSLYQRHMIITRCGSVEPVLAPMNPSILFLHSAMFGHINGASITMKTMHISAASALLSAPFLLFIKKKRARIDFWWCSTYMPRCTAPNKLYSFIEVSSVSLLPYVRLDL